MVLAAKEGLPLCMTEAAEPTLAARRLGAKRSVEKPAGRRGLATDVLLYAEDCLSLTVAMLCALPGWVAGGKRRNWLIQLTRRESHMRGILAEVPNDRFCCERSAQALALRDCNRCVAAICWCAAYPAIKIVSRTVLYLI